MGVGGGLPRGRGVLRDRDDTPLMEEEEEQEQYQEQVQQGAVLNDAAKEAVKRERIATVVGDKLLNEEMPYVNPMVLGGLTAGVGVSAASSSSGPVAVVVVGGGSGGSGGSGGGGGVSADSITAESAPVAPPAPASPSPSSSKQQTADSGSSSSAVAPGMGPSQGDEAMA
jgi:hypothetical protein